MKLISVGPIEGTPYSFGRAVDQACAELGSRAEVVIAYLPMQSKAALRAYLAAAANASRALVIGMTTGGAAFTERGVTHEGAVAGVLGEVSARSIVARDIRCDPTRSLAGALENLDIGSARSPSMLVLMDAYATEGETLVSALRKYTPASCRCFGGTAGDDWAFKETYVFHQGEVLTNAAVLLLLESPAKMAMDVLHGWSPISEGRELTITGTEYNVLQQLDGRAAADVYREELERLRLLSPYAELMPTLVNYQLGVKTPYGEHLKIRAPLGLAPEGGIVLASGLPLGERVRLVRTTPQQLVAAAEALAFRLVNQIGATLRGALVFDCAARRNVLGDLYAAEARAFTVGRSSPTAGVTSYGEFAKFGGSVEGFHNSTAVMVGW